MLFSARADALEALTKIGGSLCTYDTEGKWPLNSCDCEIGATGVGEKTGCPELRSLYYALEAMSNTEWEGMVARQQRTLFEQLAAGRPLLSVTEAAELLNVEEVAVEEWLKEEKVPAIQLPDGSYRIPQGLLLSSLSVAYDLAAELSELDGRHSDLSDQRIEEALRLLNDPEALREALPESEIAKYEAAQESIVEARRSANEVEGRKIIL